MSYTTLENRIRMVPEKYLDEVSDFVDYILYKANSIKDDNKNPDLSKHFGVIEFKKDGMGCLNRARWHNHTLFL